MYHNLNSRCSRFVMLYFDMCEGADGLPGSEFGSYERANEPSGFIKGGEFCGQLRALSFTRLTVLQGIGFLICLCSFNA
jgi:hypothetical protein